MGTNCFGRIQIVLVRFKLDFSGLIFIISTCPKSFWTHTDEAFASQIICAGPKWFWTVQIVLNQLLILYFGKNLKWTNFKDAIVTSNCDHGLVQVSLLKMQSAMDALQKVTEETVGPKRKNVRKHNRSASVAYEALAFEWVYYSMSYIPSLWIFFINLHIPYKIYIQTYFTFAIKWNRQIEGFQLFLLIMSSPCVIRLKYLSSLS